MGTEKPKLSLLRELSGLAAPMMFSNLAYTLLGVVDTLFLGRVSPAALGAVGLANLMFLTVSLAFRGTINGSTTFISRAFGARDFPQVGKDFVHFLVLAIIMTPFTFLLPDIFRTLVEWLRPNPEVARQAVIYLAIRSYGLPLTLLNTAFIGFLVGVGNTRLPALLSWTAVLVNIVANYILIFGKFGFPALGIAGAAYATVFGLGVEFILGATLVLKFYGEKYMISRWTIPTLAKMKDMMKIGLPIGLSDAMEVGAFSAFMAVISRLGTTELAVSQIANQVSSVGFMPGFALAIATGSLVGRFIGSEEIDMAERVGYLGVKISVGFMGALGALFWLFPRQLASIFTSEPAIIEAAVIPMRLIAIYQIFDAMNIVFRGALNGAGDTRFGLVVTLVGAWGIFVPVTYLLAITLDYGLAGAWSGALIYIFGLGITFLFRYRSGRWKRITTLSTV